MAGLVQRFRNSCSSRDNKKKKIKDVEINICLLSDWDMSSRISCLHHTNKWQQIQVLFSLWDEHYFVDNLQCYSIRKIYLWIAKKIHIILKIRSQNKIFLLGGWVQNFCHCLHYFLFLTERFQIHFWKYFYVEKTLQVVKIEINY